jgi:2-oxoglutarate dehydrogenase E2 component (dihydrolipoamide succinyltransferase)
MPVEVKIPAIGESITEVEIGEWLKAEGDPVVKDENVAVIESDKATFELAAPVSGTLTRLLKKTGEPASVGEVIGYIEAPKAAETKPPTVSAIDGGERQDRQTPESQSREASKTGANESHDRTETGAKTRVMPAALRLLEEHALSPEEVTATGPGGRLLKEDVLRRIQPTRSEPEAARTDSTPAQALREQRAEEALPMSLMRRRISQRLVAAQQTAALLTTFNEIEISEVAALRQKHQANFQEKHSVKLGYMSFFVRAVIDALRLVPQLNAELRGNDIVYRKYYDIGVAVGTGKGLVVPVLRNAESMSFADIELAIADFSRRAQENKLKVEELEGGTFTISNGGIYGSLLSTPIVNPPQSGILGMHAIQERPVARGGAVVIRPMMYVALTYDHRIIDGREAVTFLRRIKDTIEEPARMLLEV